MTDPLHALDALNPDHPRLLLTPSRLGRIRNARDHADLSFRTAAEQVVNHARELIDLPPLTRTLTEGRMLLVSQACRDRVCSMAMAGWVSGEDRFLDAAMRTLREVCAFEDWNAGHSLDAAEMAAAVAIGRDWLFDRLSEDDHRAIVDAIVRCALEPARQQYASGEPRWMNRVLRAFNWNFVCNGGHLIGALGVADEHPELARQIVADARASMDVALKTFAPHGSWGEGINYWDYGLRYVIWAAECLRTATGTDMGLSDTPGLENTGRFALHMHGPTGEPLAMADVGEKYATARNRWQLFWLGQRFDDDALIAFAREDLVRRGAVPDSLLFHQPPPDSVPDVARDTWFGGNCDLVTLRSRWGDPDATFASLMGGYNLVNHGHLDLGTFEIEAAGVRWAIDLGTESYSVPGYWGRWKADGKRWQYFRTASRGHNVTTVDGRNQKFDGWAGFERFHSADDRASAVLEMSGAYEAPVSAALRGLALMNGRRDVLVQDEFTLAEPARLVWGMLTRAEVDIDGPVCTLRQDGQALTMRLIGPDGASFRDESARQEPPESANEGITAIRVDIHAQAGLSRWAVLFEPDGPGRPAEDRADISAHTLTPLADWPGQPLPPRSPYPPAHDPGSGQVDILASRASE